MSVDYLTKYRFSKQIGLNTRDPAFNLKSGEASRLKNAYFPGGSTIKKRPGIEQLTASIGNYKCTGSYMFRPYGADTVLISTWADGAIRKMENLDGTWDTIGTGFDTDVNAVWGFETVEISGVLYCVMGNGVEDTQKWKIGDALVSTLGGAPPKSNIFLVFHGFLIIFDIANPLQIRWSAYRNPVSWPAPNILDFDTRNNEVIKSIKLLGQYVYIIFGDSIQRMYFTGNLEDDSYAFAREEALSGIGSLSQKGVINVNDKFLLLPNNEDYMAFAGGTDSISIFDRIRSIWNTINKSCLQYAPSALSSIYKMVLFSIPIGTNSYQTKILGFDYDNKAPLIIDGWNLNTIIRYVDSGQEVMIGGCSQATGLMYKLFMGTNDDGAAIDCEYAPGWDDCDGPDILKYFRFLRVYVKQQANSTLDVYLKSARKDIGFPSGDGNKKSINLTGTGSQLGVTFTIGVSPLGGEECLIATIPIEMWGEYLWVMFKNKELDQTMEIYGWEIQFQNIRRN